MEAADLAAELRALAKRVRRNLPLSRNPEKFHEEISGISRALEALAGQAAPAPRDQKPDRPLRQVTASRVINGRRVMVQSHRAAFAIFVGNDK